MKDFIPVLCASCGERWKHPTDTITVVLMPGKFDHVFFVCPDCGPDHVRLDNCSAQLIIYVFEPPVIDWSSVDDDDLDTLSHGLRIWLQPKLMRRVLNVELERIVGHCDEVVQS